MQQKCKIDITMTEMNATEATEKKSLNFIEQAVENDLRAVSYTHLTLPTT